MDGDLDPGAVTSQVLVDGVVENLKDAVVESALIRITDVHSGAFADRLEAFQLVDLRSSVLLATGCVLLFRNIGVVEGDDRFSGWFLGPERGWGRGAGVPRKRGGLWFQEGYGAPRGWATIFWPFTA